jgi:hypothetical protein
VSLRQKICGTNGFMQCNMISRCDVLPPRGHPDDVPGSEHVRELGTPRIARKRRAVAAYRSTFDAATTTFSTMGPASAVSAPTSCCSRRQQFAKMQIVAQGSISKRSNRHDGEDREGNHRSNERWFSGARERERAVLS